ncbi:MAG: hypothetical protein ACXV79_17305, partial [Methylobacter sp.]
EANYLSPEEAEHYNPSCFIVNYPVDFYFRLHQLPAKTFKGLPRKNCVLYSLAPGRQAISFTRAALLRIQPVQISFNTLFNC